jgi:peptide/nickel transport system permease protein
MPSRRSPVWLIGRGIAILLISGLAGATLVRLAPGFGVDERSLDARFSAPTLASIARANERERNPLTFYLGFLEGLFHGDLGRSAVFGQPVGPLIRERAPTTIRTVLEGLILGWCAALVLATAAAVSRRAVVLAVAMAFSGSLLSIPSALLATVCLLLQLSPGTAIAAVVFPRAFPHAYEQVRAALAAPYVLMARARGLARTRVFLFHVIPAALPPLVALVGVSVTLAFGASIPIEALADSPGLGQMAWRAALGRDLPVLVSVTLLLTVIAVSSNVAADLIIMHLQRRTA